MTCEVLVDQAANVHHVRPWSTRAKQSHTSVVFCTCLAPVAGHDNWTRHCSSAQGPPAPLVLAARANDCVDGFVGNTPPPLCAVTPYGTEGRQDKRGRGEQGVLCATLTDDTSSRDAAKCLCRACASGVRVKARAPLLRWRLPAWRRHRWDSSWSTTTRRQRAC